MSVKEKISRIVDKWFLYEPLLFNVYCTHKLEENDGLITPFRTGNRRIEYNPKLLENWREKEIELALQTEVARILLKHPYQRVPQYPNRAALKTASDVTIREHCFENPALHNARYYNLAEKLSYEEYYRELKFICPDCDDIGKNQLMPATKEYENHAEYQGMIVFTDCYADVPKITLNKQILWILTGKSEYECSWRWIRNLRANRATYIPAVGK